MYKDKGMGYRIQGIGPKAWGIVKNYTQYPIPYTLVLLAVVMLGVSSCREDMQDQPKYVAYRGSEMFPDSLSSRPLEAHTVARGYLREDQALYTGKSGSAVAPIAPTAGAQAAATGGSATSAVPTQPAAASGAEVNEFPFPITKEVLDR